ncbi:MAG: crossover junction endodeoxyribonuclease RuvC [Bacteroidales bacterium]|jgi:crossover junction endodeoxyribonuclease RuvC|nr:crossover junction endodeoxyribonuclease RuvC [Bacteroidales bacterium]
MVQELILGVDPGTTVMGFALLEAAGSRTSVLAIDTVRMVKLPDQNTKLKKIFESTVEIIKQHKPSILAIEAPFYGKNPQSMLKLGRAQGVVIAACLHLGLEVFEYSPRKIKQSITGKGSSSKEQVAAMLYRMCNFSADELTLDATDALAAAYCHYLQNRITPKDQNASGWASFIAKNQDRVVK